MAIFRLSQVDSGTEELRLRKSLNPKCDIGYSCVSQGGGVAHGLVELVELVCLVVIRHRGLCSRLPTYSLLCNNVFLYKSPSMGRKHVNWTQLSFHGHCGLLVRHIRVALVFVDKVFLLVFGVVDVGNFVSYLILRVVLLCLVDLGLGVKSVVLWSKDFLLARLRNDRVVVVGGRHSKIDIGRLAHACL